MHLALAVYIVLPAEMSPSQGYSRGYRQGHRAHPDPSSSNNVSYERANARILLLAQATANEFWQQILPCIHTALAFVEVELCQEYAIVHDLENDVEVGN
jgi:hypothetical protein